MSDINTPSNYIAFNQEASKNVVIVLKILGAPDLLTNTTLKTRVLYGDPEVFYGEPGLVYGGLRDYSIRNPDGSLSEFKDYLDLNNSNLTLQQKLEPEQGKASVSTLSMTFIDKDGYMTYLVSPGFGLPEILLAECEVYLGFQQTSYPQDYFRVFRGFVSQVTDGAGNVSLQISDPNLRLRTTLFFTAQDQITVDVGLTDSIINVETNSQFYQQIEQPNGDAFNVSIHDYIQIDDEWIEAEPILQDNQGYTTYIQGVTYTAAPSHGLDIAITYIGGGTAGSEIVTILGAQITVQIQAGVSTATQIVNALLQNLTVSTLVTMDIYAPLESSAQTTQTQTFLEINPYNVAVIQGIIYYQAPLASGVTITYTSGAVHGSEVVSVIGSAITVQISVGFTDANDILAALNNYESILVTLVSFNLLPNAGLTIQAVQSSTAMTTGTPGTQFAVIQRGARGTVAATHTVSDDPNSPTTVSAGIQVGDLTFHENAMDMALKLQLSGWGGPWISSVQVVAFNISPDPLPAQTTTNIIQFPSGVDVVNDYGLVAGDYLTIYGSSNATTNATQFQIVRFGDYQGQSNRLIYINSQIIKENTTTATVNFRSQYDQYPINAGLMLTPKDVDITQHIYIKQTFLGVSANDLLFFITAQESSGKDFIQTEVYFPIGAYGLTRYGKLSCGYNSPPLASQNLVTLDETDILNPDQINVSRSTNSRTLYNEIDFSYGVLDDGSTFTKVLNAVSAPSLNALGGYTNVLPITSRGLYASYPENLIQKYALFLLNKYAFSVTQIPLKVNWRAGSVIEVGDVAILDDSKGILQIANFQTGKRGLGRQLFNIIDRTFNIKEGTVDLTLQSGLGATVTDRFATISPSSIVATGSTMNQIIIQDSFGAIFPGNESKKWQNSTGLPILVHSFDYSVSAQTTLLGIDPVNNYALNTTGLPFTPLPGYIVDVPDYPTSADPTVNELYKTLYCFLDPTVTVVSGVDQRNFTVGSGDISKFFVGSIITIHSLDYSIDSGEVTVTLIVGNQITVDQPLGFVAAAGQHVELIGFADKGYAYRFI